MQSEVVWIRKEDEEKLRTAVREIASKYPDNDQWKTLMVLLGGGFIRRGVKKHKGNDMEDRLKLSALRLKNYKNILIEGEALEQGALDHE